MESPVKRSRGRTTPDSDAGRRSPEYEEFSVSAVEVTDVVRRGMGPKSRIELTVGCAGRRVRITLLTKRALSYKAIAQSAVGEGLVLPYHRYADGAWWKVLARGMEHARVEPWLEGEEIAEAIAAEIRARLKAGPRGEGASDLKRGKVVKRAMKRGDRLLVSPTAFTCAVRERLVDDVVSRETIAEAARMHLGMEELRPDFPDGRPHAWAFPLPLAAAREPEEAPADAPVDAEELEGSAAPEPVEAHRFRLADSRAILGSSLAAKRSKTGSDGPQEVDLPCDPVHGPMADVVSPLSTEGWERDPMYREKSNFRRDPVHGPEAEPDISSGDREMRPGSEGPAEKNSHDAGPARGGPVLGALSLMSDEMPAGSNGRRNGGPKS